MFYLDSDSTVCTKYHTLCFECDLSKLWLWS